MSLYEECRRLGISKSQRGFPRTGIAELLNIETFEPTGEMQLLAEGGQGCAQEPWYGDKPDQFFENAERNYESLSQNNMDETFGLYARYLYGQIAELLFYAGWERVDEMSYGRGLTFLASVTNDTPMLIPKFLCSEIERCCNYRRAEAIPTEKSQIDRAREIAHVCKRLLGPIGEQMATFDTYIYDCGEQKRIWAQPQRRTGGVELRVLNGKTVQETHGASTEAHTKICRDIFNYVLGKLDSNNMPLEA